MHFPQPPWRVQGPLEDEVILPHAGMVQSVSECDGGDYSPVWDFCNVGRHFSRAEEVRGFGL